MRRNYDISTLSQYKYPNLIAEIMETGYSICTLSEHMGLGRREENDSLMREKIFGDVEITTSEALGLSRLFCCKMDYLFSHSLKMLNDRPFAYWRHYDSNRSQALDLEIFRLSEDIRKTLKEKPYLLNFVREAIAWTEEQVAQATILLQQKTA